MAIKGMKTAEVSPSTAKSCTPTDDATKVSVKEIAHAAAPELTPIPFAELHLGTVDEFQQLHPLHDHCIVTIYQIVRDLHIKQEVIDIDVVDGTPWGQSGYFIEGRSRHNGKMRLMVPFYLDAEIDLVWLRKLALACDERDEELILCIHTTESIIYELISTELP